jgi:RNA polymerase sigma-70 factor (ECF subfamily)
MDDAIDDFPVLRPRLERIAFRILGSRAQAQAIVDRVAVLFRLQCTVLDAPGDPAAWLVSTTSRLALERWRAAGPWPDVAERSVPLLQSNRIVALTQDILTAAYAGLERLEPDLRLAFLLHDIFGADLAELASTVGRSEADCQSLVERARHALRQHHPRQLP